MDLPLHHSDPKATPNHQITKSPNRPRYHAPAMPTLTIDGTPCDFEHPQDGPKKSILQVALDHGVEIPHYCYHPGMSVVASCRICLAEVAQPNPRNEGKVELVPKLVPTCQTPAEDKMEVFLDSPKSVANQKAVMEYLLINHPLDCPVCDQAGECYLQDYSYKFGRSQSRFLEQKIKQPKKDLGPNVLLYSDRCIMCTRCVRFTKEITGTNEIGVFGRGSSEQIDVFPGHPLDNELSANVIDLCPVGALLDKDFLMTMRVWNLQKTPSIDGITASGDNLSIEHNDGKVYRIKPRTNMEVNTWWTSDEIRYGWHHVHSEDRLTSPLLKTQGTHDEIDWKRAYREAVDMLRGVVRDRGPRSLALLVSPMLTCEDAFLLGRLVLAIDEQAVIGVGPVPRKGEDKTFPGGYTVYAEKAPNARGVRRALERVTDDILDYDQWMQKVANTSPQAPDVNPGLAGIGGILLTGNYPSTWATSELLALAAHANITTVLLDTLSTPLTDQADLILPTCTWLEKEGTFENANGRLQSFDAAIPPLSPDPTSTPPRPEAQIALDLLAALGEQDPERYRALHTRQHMAGPFLDEVHEPAEEGEAVAEMEWVTL